MQEILPAYLRCDQNSFPQRIKVSCSCFLKITVLLHSLNNRNWSGNSELQVGQGWASSRSSRGGSFLTLPASGAPGVPGLVATALPSSKLPISLPTVPSPSLLCLCKLLLASLKYGALRWHWAFTEMIQDTFPIARHFIISATSLLPQLIVRFWALGSGRLPSAYYLQADVACIIAALLKQTPFSPACAFLVVFEYRTLIY